jgi:PKD repeat protein
MVIADTPTPPAVELGIYPNVGIAPHRVTVTIPSIPDRESARTQIDFNGDGVVDAIVYSLDTTVTYTYQTPGIYFARTTLDDYAGGVYTQTFPIVVRDVKALDRMLQGIFNGMLGKLKVGDIEGALKSFTPSAVEQYRPVFEDLRANLATVVEQFGTIVTGSIAEEFAEYVLVRNKGTGKQAYLIYFFRGSDGVWRISQM